MEAVLVMRAAILQVAICNCVMQNKVLTESLESSEVLAYNLNGILDNPSSEHQKIKVHEMKYNQESAGPYEQLS